MFSQSNASVLSSPSHLSLSLSPYPALRWCFAGLLVLALASPSRAQDSAGIEVLWRQAAELERNGDYALAAQIYAAILELLPNSQRAASKIAVCQFEASMRPQALESAVAALAMNSHSRVWAEWGYLYKARACRHLGCVEEAREAIGILRDRFPDSISTTRAEVLEAELNGGDATAAHAALANEEAAEALHEAATDAATAQEYDQAVALFDAVVAQFPTTRKSLRSMEIKALMLGGLPDRTEQTAQALDDLLAAVRDAWPHSRIRYEAQTRRGYLHLRLRQSAEALAEFDELAQIADDPVVKATAKVEAAGAYFETLQRRRESRESVGNDEWEQVRQRCQEARTLPGVTMQQRVRADLMIVESLAWQRRPALALPAAEEFIAEHDADAYPQEVATARQIAGEALQRAGRHSEALEHYRWIAERFGEQEIWPGMDNLARAYYRIYDALNRSGAPRDEVDSAAEYVLTHFPDSQYADLVRSGISQRDHQAP